MYPSTHLLELGFFVDEVVCVDASFVVVFFGALALFVGGGTTTTPAEAYLKQGHFSAEYSVKGSVKQNSPHATFDHFYAFGQDNIYAEDGF